MRQIEAQAVHLQDQLSLDAVAALDKCDMRTAHSDFVGAHAADPHHPQAALGFAITDLALLPEAPEATDLLSNLGFTAPIDMEVLVFGTDGVLARMSRQETCQSITTFLNSTVPYPPLRESNVSGWSVLRPGITGETFRADLAALMGHFSAQADALETAANALNGTNNRSYAIKGSSCGQSTAIALQRPELYAAAALLEWVHAAMEILLAYDWAMDVALLQGSTNAQRTQLAQELDAHFGHLQDASGVGRGKAALAHALTLSTNALDAATAARTPVTNELFDWPSFPVDRLADLRRMVVSAQGALDTATALADITPTLTANLGPLFANPPDASHLSGPLFVTQTDASGTVSISLDNNQVDTAIGSTTSPSFFVSPVPTYQWGPSPSWNQLQSDPIIAPVKALQTTFGCR